MISIFILKTFFVEQAVKLGRQLSPILQMFYFPCYILFSKTTKPLLGVGSKQKRLNYFFICARLINSLTNY